MSREAEREYTQARSSFAALVATIGRGKNAADRKRLASAEERLKRAQEALDEEAAHDHP